MKTFLNIVLFPVTMLAFLLFGLKAVISITFFFIFAGLTVTFSWAYLGSRRAMNFLAHQYTR